MRVSSGQGVAQMSLHADAQAAGHAEADVEPNREFPDLWLRFVSSVAQFERQAQDSEKTLAAHGLAASPGREVHRIDLSQVVSKYIGDTEKNLDAVLQDAARSGAVLLLDEADALFGKRTEVRDSSGTP